MTSIIHIGHSLTDIVGGIATDIVSGQIGENHFVVNTRGQQEARHLSHPNASILDSGLDIDPVDNQVFP